MKRKILIFIILNFLISFCFAEEKLYIVATTQDLANFAEVISGEYAKVVSLTYGWQDPHRIEPKPSMVVHLKKADLVLKIGMDLDNWVDSLIFTSGNKKIFYGEVGYLDCSTRIKKLEIPQGKVNLSMGDIHIFGNPHYWLSPENAKIIVEDITEKLIILMPEKKDYFLENKKKYFELLDKKISEWKQRISKLENKKVVSYHKTFVYFYDFFGLNEILTIEQKPGVPPTPKYISYIIKKIEEEKLLVILHEIFYSVKNTEFISKKTNVRYEIVPTSVGASKEIKDYITLIDTLVEVICK